MIDDIYTEEGFAISHYPLPSTLDPTPGFLDTVIGPLPSWYEKFGAGLKESFVGALSAVGEGVGKGAGKLTQPLVNQVVFILIIVIIGIFVLGKSKTLKVGL